MTIMDASLIHSDLAGKSLTAPLALSLAESAYKAGRLESATRYLNIAYAIFDAQVRPRMAEPSSLPPIDD